MRDLIRNYKRILAGKNRDSDSDSESQPLMSSGSASGSNFGAVATDPIVYKLSDSSFDSEDSLNLSDSYHLYPRNPITSLAVKKRLERQSFPPNFEPPELDVYTNEENVCDCHKNYAKITGLISEESNSVNLEKKDIFKRISSSESFEIFPDEIVEDIIPTHNSVVTIFAIWNTTLGTSLLSMAWGLEKSGLFAGIGINIGIAGICLYTAYVILCINQKHGMPGQDIEVCDLCKMLLGKWAEILAKIFSIVVLIGANIVYWILMSNFLYNSVYFGYVIITSKPEEPVYPNTSVLCPKEVILNLSDPNSFLYVQEIVSISTFDKIWNLYSTVPVVLGVIMFPVLNFRSPTFFTKFNSLGTVSIGYVLVFVAVKAAKWGVNMPDWNIEFNIKPTFCALSGMLSLSYFIHNIIIAVMRNNRHQQHNGRDLSIAFGLVTFTYLFIGVLFYVCFPMAKSCIEDNILNNFSKRDLMTIVARVLLMFQLFTVFPLITFMLRNDVLTNINNIFHNHRFGDFTYGRVVSINAVMIFICVMFACFMPRIGTLIRYTGAMSGMVYIFMLPNLLQIASLRKEKKLTTLKLIFHSVIISIGVLNLLSQFFISD